MTRLECMIPMFDDFYSESNELPYRDLTEEEVKKVRKLIAWIDELLLEVDLSDIRGAAMKYRWEE